jgi:hypothetical protein
LPVTWQNSTIDSSKCNGKPITYNTMVTYDRKTLKVGMGTELGRRYILKVKSSYT